MASQSVTLKLSIGDANLIESILFLHEQRQKAANPLPPACDREAWEEKLGVKRSRRLRVAIQGAIGVARRETAEKYHATR